jgi:RNA polymerase sigma-70 factor (ECF subfamily)
MIFDRYAAPVRRFLRDLLGDETSADEATQETFVRAHRQLATLCEQDRLVSWLFGIARNVSFEHRRSRKRLLAAGDALPESVDRAPTPEAAVLSGESDRLLSRALAQLGEERRAALLLRIDHGLGYDEIATTMGWSLAKVKNEIHRARLELRAVLEPYVGGRS